MAMMHMAITDKIRKYDLVMKTNLQSNMAYASNFLFRMLFYAFLVFIFIQLWSAIYKDGGSISGYTLNQMIWYFIFTELIATSGSSAFGSLSEDIKGGNIAYLMNKPYNYLIYQFFNTMGFTVVVVAVNSIAGVAMGFAFAGPLTGFNPACIPVFIVSMTLAILLNFFITACLGLSAFWLEENYAINWIYSKLVLILGVFLPIEFLPEWLQKITLLLPFPYIAYGPAKLAVDFTVETAVRIVVIQAAYLAAFVIAAFLIYAKGVKKLNVNGG